MSLIVAENITYAYQAQRIVHNASFRVGELERIGFVGPNGAGKTTLLRLITGELDPIAGSIHRSKQVSIGVLPQDAPPAGDRTVREDMLRVFDDVRAVEARLETLAAELEGHHEDTERMEQYGTLQTRFETLGGYDYHQRIERVLSGLKFPREYWDKPLAQLSGGQRTRALLAKLLLQDPDVLLLDEPTNHLDLDAVEWLEQYLKDFRGALLTVSHDRYFLDQVTRDTWEINSATLETYRGSYSDYLQKREQRYEQRMREWRAQQEYIAKTEEFIRIHLAGQRTKEAQGRRSRLERFVRDEAIEKPPEQQNIHLDFQPRKRSGDIVLRAEDLKVGYAPDTPFATIDELELMRTRHVAIVGANGTGKTTLLKSLLGQLETLCGTVKFGANVEIAYLSQTHAELDPETTPLDALKRSTGCSTQQVRDMLGKLLLGGDASTKKIGELSGGQRSRIVLARLALSGANLLVLDEPTNHLDVASAEILQEALQDFDGTVLMVSHDRYLVQHVSDEIWALDDGTLHTLRGGWEDYLTWRVERREEKNQQQAAKKHGNQTSKEQRKEEFRKARKKTNRLQKLQRRHEELEDLIDKTETELQEINDAISAAGQAGDMEKIESLGKDFESKNAELANLWTEWEDVGEELEAG